MANFRPLIKDENLHVDLVEVRIAAYAQLQAASQMDTQVAPTAPIVRKTPATQVPIAPKVQRTSPRQARAFKRRSAPVARPSAAMNRAANQRRMATRVALRAANTNTPSQRRAARLPMNRQFQNSVNALGPIKLQAGTSPLMAASRRDYQNAPQANTISMIRHQANNTLSRVYRMTRENNLDAHDGVWNEPRNLSSEALGFLKPSFVSASRDPRVAQHNARRNAPTWRTVQVANEPKKKRPLPKQILRIG